MMKSLATREGEPGVCVCVCVCERERVCVCKAWNMPRDMDIDDLMKTDVVEKIK